MKLFEILSGERAMKRRLEAAFSGREPLLAAGASYTGEHYRTAMVLLPASALLGVAASFFLKESFRHHDGPVGH